VADPDVDWDRYASPLGFSISGVIPRDPLIEEYDLEERSLLQIPEQSAALQAAFRIFENILTDINQ